MKTRAHIPWQRAGIALLGLSAVLGIAAPEPARAAAPPSADNAALLFDFHIPAKPLLAALADFAAVTAIQVIQPSGQALTGNAPGVEGHVSASEALATLLSGSGFVFRFTDANSVVLYRPTSDGSLHLSPVTVEGTTSAGTASDSASGYVARRSASATKTDTPLLETPQSVSVITADQMADRGISTVQAAVAYTAGVSVGASGDDPRFDQMAIRGFDATSTSDFLDGLRQPNTGWLSYFGTEPYGLERVEVIKGPASVLYGQIDPGGLINRVSKRPSDTPIDEVGLQAGNNNRYQGQFDLGGAVDGQGSLLFRLVGLAREANLDIRQIDDNTRFLAPSLLWRPNDDTTLTILTQYQYRRTGGSPRPYQVGDTLTDFWAGDQRFDRLEQTQYTAGYALTHTVNSMVSLNQNLRVGKVDTVNQYLLTGDVTNGHILDRTAYGVYERMNTIALDNQAKFDFATGPVTHTVLTGIDYSWRSSHVLYSYGDAPSIDMWAPDYRQAIAPPDTVISDQNTIVNMGGAYVQEQMAFGGWRLSGGARRDQAFTDTRDNQTRTHAKTSDGATTGRVGLLYLFESGIAPYASYATSFMPDGGTDIYGNPYKPTEGEQYEAGLKIQPHGLNSLFTASLYQLTQTNVKTTDPNNPLNSIQTGEQRSRGLELEGVAQLADGLKLTASLTLSRAEITRSNNGDQGKKPVETPEKLASLWADYTLPSGPLAGLGGGIGARWTGPSYSDSANTEKNKDYTITDLEAHYDLDGTARGARLALNVNNLLDERYITCASGYCYRGAGRSIIGSVRYRW